MSARRVVVVVLVVCQLQAVAMASLKQLNPNSEIAHSAHALMMNIGAAQGLQEVLKTNLGPRGTIKMYARHLLPISHSVRYYSGDPSFHFLLPLPPPTPPPTPFFHSLPPPTPSSNFFAP